MDQVDNPPIDSLFRPAKKRKFMRRRAEQEAENIAHADPALVANREDDTPDSTLPMSNSIRRPRVARRGGIGFSTNSRLGHEQGQQLALGPAAGDTEDDKIRAMNERFTGYTGQTEDVDRHMYDSSPKHHGSTCMI